MTLLGSARLAVSLLFSMVLACGNAPSRDAGWVGRRLEADFGELQSRQGGFNYTVGGVPLALFVDVGHDRMRIMAEVREWHSVPLEQREAVMEANFRSALDARYGREGGMLYALYLHPLGSLTPEELHSASLQVASLVKTFGRSYSSSDLRFGKGRTSQAF